MTFAGVYLAVLACARAYAGVPATVATDICAAGVDPCDVTQVYDITDNAVLDFGTRAVNVSGSGQFNFGAGSGKIRSGNFTANTASPAIDANGSAPVSGTDSGAILIEARRKCTGGTPEVPCVSLAGCQLGACNARRCTGRTTKTCLQDSNCQIGPCGGGGRCAGSQTIVRCKTNADCDYGTCPAQLTCANRAENPVACAVNSDCDFGTCTVGTASIVMGGPIVGNSDNPASIDLRAADSVTISKNVNLNSSDIESDGGELTVEAAAGDVTITGKITAEGGGDSQGGTIDLRAGNDVIINEDINVDGGDFDGGAVEISADRDVALGRSLSANATSGAGYGGEILIEAGRDLTITSPSALNKTSLDTSGHTDIENFSGDGGTQDITTGRHMSMLVNTRMTGNGSIPDAYGSDIYFDVSGDFLMEGAVTAKAQGGQGEGGYVEIVSSGMAQVGSSGSFDLTGGNSGGGVLQLESGGDTIFDGTADVGASNGGLGGSLLLDVGANASVSGKLSVNGTGAGDLEIEACRVTLTATGKLENKVTTGANRVTSFESMKFLAGSSVTSGASGQNKLIYRTNDKKPILLGTVSPAPIEQLNPALKGCPVCGNSEIDKAETCDDGNTVNGDGCNSSCQNENCLAQTAGPFPCTTNGDCAAPRTCDALVGKCIPNPICDDDDPCTVDTCNNLLEGGTCEHAPKVCDDSISCTTDTCNAVGACVFTPSDAACQDGNECTTNLCSPATGCTSTNNNNACTDGNECTDNDACIEGICTGTPIQGCGVCGDGEVTSGEECDDGNATFVTGEYCGVDCVLIPCGKPTNSSGTAPRTSDAQYVLRDAVGQVSKCDFPVCDVDSNSKVNTTDALRILRKAVGQLVTLVCPPAPGA